MAPTPRTPADMNRLNAARAAGLVMPGGGERQEELASLPGKTPATAQNMPAGFTLADIQRMMSDPSRYGKIYADQKAAPAKAGGGKGGGEKRKGPGRYAKPTEPGGVRTGEEQTVVQPEPGLNSPLWPLLLPVGAAGLARYLTRKGGPAGTAGMAPGQTATPDDAAIQHAIVGNAAKENIIDAEWSPARDLPGVPNRAALPPPADIAGGGATGVVPPPELGPPGAAAPPRLPSMATGAAQAGAQGPMDILQEVVKASGLKPGVAAEAAPKKTRKRTPRDVEELAGRRRTRTPEAPSGRISERTKVKTPKVRG